MPGKTKIEWATDSWNPTTGCTKVSQGCKNCYAERVFPRVYGARPFTDVRFHTARLDQPLRWRRPRRVFVNSMSDLFHEDVPEDFIDRVFAVMALCPQHTFQILTKRPKQMLAYLTHPVTYPRVRDEAGVCIDPFPPINVWLGVSVEDQATADERIPLLLQTPAAVRWISAEPLIGPVDLDSTGGLDGHYVGGLIDFGSGTDKTTRVPRVDWVVVGGESGPKARPMHPDWVRSLRDQCVGAGVPFFFKQWGEWAPRSACYHTLTNGSAAADIDPIATRWPCIRLTVNGADGHDAANTCDGDDVYMQKVGKRLAGRLLDGREWNEYP